MILKSACSNNPSYIDRLISVFMRSLQKMVREHLSPQAASGSTEAASGDALGRPRLGPRRHHHLLLTAIPNVSLTTRVEHSFKVKCFLSL